MNFRVQNPVPWQARVVARRLRKVVGERLPGSADVFPRYFRGKALSWQVAGEVLEVELFGTPCNEIGTTLLGELEQLAHHIESGGVSDSCKAILFFSSVERGFSAGADLRELYEGLVAHHVEVSAERVGVREKWEVASEVRSFLDRIHHVFNVIDMAPLTTVACVHGFCFGGGFELALTCDVIIAEKSARFAFPELRLGLVPGFGGIPRLRRDVGNAVIRDLLFTGRSLNATRAKEVGLVSQVVGRGKGLAAARGVTKQATRFDAATTRTAKRFVKPLPLAELEHEKDVFVEMLGSPVVLEALQRFVESESVRPYLP